MRILFIAAGAGSTYCGACNQDISLVRNLIALGHRVQIIPLYTPITADGDNPIKSRIFYGGINVFLQQQFSLFRKIPPAWDALLDNRHLLGMVGRFAIRTQPETLGEMTLSVLKGENGNQRKEMHRLLNYLDKSTPNALKPDIAIITNTMLAAVGGVLHRRYKIPVACQVQGEEDFLQRLGDTWSPLAIAECQRQIQPFSRIFAPSKTYRDKMAAFLNLDKDFFSIIPPGIDEAYLNTPPCKTIRRKNIPFPNWFSIPAPIP